MGRSGGVCAFVDVLSLDWEALRGDNGSFVDLEEGVNEQEETGIGLTPFRRCKKRFK